MATQGGTSRLAQMQSSVEQFMCLGILGIIKMSWDFQSLTRFSSDGALRTTTLQESWAGRNLIKALNQLPPMKYASSADMRFQQKQQQEREQKKLELSGPSKSNLESGDGRQAIGAGKVRQMFDERRQRGTGIDKSYPLKPIVGRTASGSATATKTSTTTTTVRKQVGSVKQVNGRITSMKTTEKTHVINGNGISTSEHIFLTHDSLDNESMPATPDFANGFDDNYNLPEFNKLSIQDSYKSDSVDGIEDRNNNSGSGKSSINTSIKLNPVITKKTAPPMRSTVSPIPPARLGTPRAAQKVQSPMGKPSPGIAARPKTVSKTPPSSASSVRSSLSATKTESASTITPRPPAGPIPENMAQCPICGRNFNVDRIAKHKEICQKTATKKRKIFDASKHRVRGTEIEQYVKKAPKAGGRAPVAAKTMKPAATTDKKSNWRKKHEEFIATIRAAKELKAHLARGGKLSDLPPPPPSENPDYVQCPHCQRRFNEAAANRHIPKCATMLHNKPKPGSKPALKKR